MEELEIFERVKAILKEKTKVPCTACAYCMPCPSGVDIPGCFAAYNDKFLLNNKHDRIKYLQTLGVFSRSLHLHPNVLNAVNAKCIALRRYRYGRSLKG
jgi:predicted aldo/keto reductase-like oxidoreductase